MMEDGDDDRSSSSYYLYHIMMLHNKKKIKKRRREEEFFGESGATMAQVGWLLLFLTINIIIDPRSRQCESS